MNRRELHQRETLDSAVRDLQNARFRRDKIIRLMHDDGLSLREIARAASLSHAGIKKIVERHD